MDYSSIFDALLELLYDNLAHYTNLLKDYSPQPRCAIFDCSKLSCSDTLQLEVQ
jgi:hypothetical protein